MNKTIRKAIENAAEITIGMGLNSDLRGVTAFLALSVAMMCKHWDEIKAEDVPSEVKTDG